MNKDAATLKQVRALALKIAVAINELEAKLDSQAKLNTAQLKIINSILSNIEENGNG